MSVIEDAYFHFSSFLLSVCFDVVCFLIVVAHGFLQNLDFSLAG